MIGLRRGSVALVAHQKTWEDVAARTISHLRQILGDVLVDAQHVGSTSIRGIHAKPIIDIALAVRSLDDLLPFIPALEREGYLFRRQDLPGQLLFVVCGAEADIRTHHIHATECGSEAWQNYLNFRDYLNAFPEQAARYDALKRQLAQSYADDRGQYTAGKEPLIRELLEAARRWRGESAT